jgi:hypothetical protein
MHNHDDELDVYIQWSDGTYSHVDDADWTKYNRSKKSHRAIIEKFERDHDCRLVTICKIYAQSLPRRSVQ